MSSWKAPIDVRLPYWRDYRELIGYLPDDEFPDATALNGLLPEAAVSQGGLPVRFVPPSLTTGTYYEKQIFETGQVSTRENNWHDLFNALVWCRLPQSKAAMNTLHYERLDEAKDGRRGSLRDALTLLDESGVIVIGRNKEVLQSLAARDWNRAFVTLRDAWREELRLVVCGHALLEKFLKPYKAVTAHALLLNIEGEYQGLPCDMTLPALDTSLARGMLSGALLNSSACLSPLPLMGIPGWARQQDQGYYEDLEVFRPARDFQRLAKVKPVRFSA